MSVALTHLILLVSPEKDVERAGEAPDCEDQQQQEPLHICDNSSQGVHEGIFGRLQNPAAGKKIPSSKPSAYGFFGLQKTLQRKGQVASALGLCTEKAAADKMAHPMAACAKPGCKRQPARGAGAGGGNTDHSSCCTLH